MKPQDNEDAREAEQMGERPDLGHRPDALKEALSGSDMGSDTTAGSLQGGAATGGDDPDQDAINDSLTSEGMRPAGEGRSFLDVSSTETVNNTGQDGYMGAAGDPVEGKPGVPSTSQGAGDDADAATG